MVYRVYVEKKSELAHEAASLLGEIKNLLQIDGVTGVRILNRYDVENIEKSLFDYAVSTVFSEPQLDIVTFDYENDGSADFAVEYLPGQFDQRADSAAQCIQIISQGERPTVKTARIYKIYGDVSADTIDAIKKYVINPVESREASFEEYETLAMAYTVPESVATLGGFTELDEKGLADFIAQYGLAMDIDDIRFCRDYFRTEQRDPTITEIKMIDT